MLEELEFLVDRQLIKTLTPEYVESMQRLLNKGVEPRMLKANVLRMAESYGGGASSVIYLATCAWLDQRERRLLEGGK